MSSATNNFDNVYAQQPPPQHHQHTSSDILPGARGASEGTFDYSADVTTDPRVWQTNNERRFGAGTDTGAVMAGGQHSTTETDAPSTWDNSAAHPDRPMNVQTTNAGGVAIDGRDDLPEGHAKLTDKIIGKTQKVTGKMMHKPELHEKGELREAGGKEAAAGRARALHD
ncbi:hypothetical protein PHLGIDRAFT_119589 [Phlebiopsis gigantea 11061_1 CR5-6]|uniref:CsbD-like domain-containing protein n=1 Tax=Phlebiopsis gigantea (strain 11061_1 CR5-6) TaxID=745531 RepID=A0A0C3RW35_PHLG1|nr:hypothetical protein PHLGIDRAFT_119589 [Phlebiopsis gigantea 11061_1 CR5-6]